MWHQILKLINLFVINVVTFVWYPIPNMKFKFNKSLIMAKLWVILSFSTDKKVFSFLSSRNCTVDKS